MESLPTRWGVATIGGSGLCQTAAYIYCGYSLNVGVGYVGMTLDRRGVLGRWAAHLSGEADRSSFRRRLDEWDEDAWSRLDDLAIFWADLGPFEAFLTLETSHRESVEYLVQRDLRTLLVRKRIPIQIVSVVRSNSTADLPVVKEAAGRVLASFERHLVTLPVG
jgi:hypothetical protein